MTAEYFTQAHAAVQQPGQPYVRTKVLAPHISYSALRVLKRVPFQTSQKPGSESEVDQPLSNRSSSSLG